MEYTYDKEADAIYIYVSYASYSYGINLDNERRIDYDAKGNPRGIELLSVSNGVLTDDLPFRNEVERILGDN